MAADREPAWKAKQRKEEEHRLLLEDTERRQIERGVPGSTPGIFDDDLLAVAQDRLEGFQQGPYACAENQTALEHVRAAREALGLRVARRMAQGVLGANEAHKS
jgi:hypothetical protein